MSTTEQEKRQRGRPVGSFGTKTSKLKRLANKLRTLAETSAMDIVEDSLKGKSVDKEQLATAKFTINAAKQFHQAVVAEEEDKKLISDSETESTVEVEEKPDGAAVFKLHMTGT